MSDVNRLRFRHLHSVGIGSGSTEAYAQVIIIVWELASPGLLSQVGK